MSKLKQAIVNEVESNVISYKSFLSIPNILDYFEVIPGNATDTQGKLLRKSRIVHRHYKSILMLLLSKNNIKLSV